MFTDLGYCIGINGLLDHCFIQKDELLIYLSKLAVFSCSLKTQENIEVMCSIDERWLLIETDCPWCEIKPSHAGHNLVKSRVPCIKKEAWRGEMAVKGLFHRQLITSFVHFFSHCQMCLFKIGRNEPAALVQVMEIVAAARNQDFYLLANTIRHNTMKLFKF